MKLCQVSNIAQHHFHSSHEVISAIIYTNSYDNMHESGYNTLKIQLPLTFKGHPMSNIIFDLLYVFHINFCHNMDHSEDTAH